LLNKNVRIIYIKIYVINCDFIIDIWLFIIFWLDFHTNQNFKTPIIEFLRSDASLEQRSNDEAHRGGVQ
jgi:hypothetical protein